MHEIKGTIDVPINSDKSSDELNKDSFIFHKDGSESRHLLLDAFDYPVFIDEVEFYL